LVDYTERYLPGARRFDVGQRTNFGLVPMAIAALDQILGWTVPAISHTLATVTGQLTDRARALGLDVPDPASRGPHMLGLPLPPGAGPTVLDRLHVEGITAGVRGTSLRISPHLHTTQDDIDRLTAVLAAAL
jgi:selenocysteine lyase/cysteine desulfurase